MLRFNSPIIGLTLVLFSLPASAWARAAGDTLLQAGWLHIRPDVSNSAPRNRLRSHPLFPVLGVEEDFRSESVRLRAANDDTLGLIFKRFFTDHIVLTLVAGVPPKSGVRAEGIVKPTGPTGEVNRIDLGQAAFNPASQARQWTPIFLYEYHFLAPETRLRPWLGLGLSYAFFTEVTLNDELKAEINEQFGAPLALLANIPGDTRTRVELDPTLSFAFAGGVNIRLSKHWSVTGSVTYLPLETDSRVIVEAADGTRLATASTTLSFAPTVWGLLLGYRW